MQREDDLTLDFDEPTHTYTCSTGQVMASVTETIETYFIKFDSKVVIPRMMASRNWPNSEYYGMTAEQIETLWDKNRNRGTRLHTALETICKAACADTEFGPLLNVTLLQQLAATVAEDPSCAKDVVQGWSLSLEHSLELKKELGYFYNFCRIEISTESELYALPEFRIFSTDLHIAGTIDLLLYNKEGKCLIFDWKRVSNMRLSCPFQKGKAPFEDMDDCNYNHYTLQLNLYRHILENNYTLRGIKPKVKEMKLFVFHPNNANYVIYNVGHDQRVALIRHEEDV